MNFPIDNYDGFIFDLDGTIYLEDNLIPRADEVVNYLLSINKQLIFISNKTTGTTKDYYSFLKSRGLNIHPNMIINSALVLKDYLSNYYKSCSFFAIGEESFVSEIIEAGLVFSNNPKEIDIVIVTLDRTFNYSKLEIAAKALDKGAKFFAANIDNTCPVEGGEILDAGATISALEKRTHRNLEKHFGKPSESILNMALDHLKISREKCLIIGDRLETDIAMGNLYNIDTVYVKSGVLANEEDLQKYNPTFILDSVANLI